MWVLCSHRKAISCQIIIWQCLLTKRHCMPEFLPMLYVCVYRSCVCLLETHWLSWCCLRGYEEALLSETGGYYALVIAEWYKNVIGFIFEQQHALKCRVVSALIDCNCQSSVMLPLLIDVYIDICGHTVLNIDYNTSFRLPLPNNVLCISENRATECKGFSLHTQQGLNVINLWSYIAFFKFSANFLLQMNFTSNS